MRSILDTSVLLGPNPGEIQGEIAISTVSLAELHFGVLVARSDDIRATVCGDWRQSSRRSRLCRLMQPLRENMGGLRLPSWLQVGSHEPALWTY